MGRRAAQPAPSPAAAPAPPTPALSGGNTGQLSGDIQQRLDTIQQAVDRNNDAISALGQNTQMNSPQQEESGFRQQLSTQPTPQPLQQPSFRTGGK